MSQVKRSHLPGCRSIQSQKGMALIIALIFMVVLTLIGVSSISTTMLEERMAGNLQASTAAFQAAETGVARVLNAGLFSTGDACDSSSDYTSPLGVGTSSTEHTCQDFLQNTAPGRSTTPQGQESVSYNHFDIESIGNTGSNAEVTVHQGVRYLGPSASDAILEEGG